MIDKLLSNLAITISRKLGIAIEPAEATVLTVLAISAFIVWLFFMIKAHFKR